MAEPGPVDAPCDLGAWRELYAKLNVPWRDPATGAVESAPRRSTPAFAPPVTAPQAPPADGWRDDGAVESAFDSLIGADSEQREAADVRIQLRHGRARRLMQPQEQGRVHLRRGKREAAHNLNVRKVTEARILPNPANILRSGSTRSLCSIMLTLPPLP